MVEVEAEVAEVAEVEVGSCWAGLEQLHDFEIEVIEGSRRRTVWRDLCDWMREDQ